MTAWRLLVHGLCEPAWNMAVDEALLSAAAAGHAPPTLRLYRWSRPAVSIGRHQDPARGIDLARCAALGVPIVRRPTGGRGILHGGDLTVSIVVSAGMLRGHKTVAEGFRHLSAGLVRALEHLGVPVQHGGPRGSMAPGDCFACCTGADLVTELGEKIAGSAQRRTGGAVLQQTSVRHLPDAVDPADVFLGPVGRTTFPLAGLPVEALQAAVVRGYTRALGADFELGRPASTEAEIAPLHSPHAC